MQLFILSCGDITDDPNDGSGFDDIKPHPSSFLFQVVDKLLVDSNGRYHYYYSDGGRTYTPYAGVTHIFIKDVSSNNNGISLSRAVYRLQHQNFYFGHEIREGALYATDEAINNIENINWAGAEKVGEFTVDYSASFLSFVVGKTIELCQRYFDPQTGRMYLSKYQPTKNAFEFVQALSATTAIYENVTGNNTKFLGLKTVGLDLYETKESDNISGLDWGKARKVGVLE